jgi:hypothetical protein
MPKRNDVLDAPAHLRGHAQEELGRAPEAEAPEAPAVPSLSGTQQPPPLLGAAPTTSTQLRGLVPGSKASHFTGPVVSGPTPGSPDGIAGAAVLTATFSIDYTMGNFALPIQFPVNSILLWAQSVVIVAYDLAEPTVELGTAANGADILALTPFAGVRSSEWQAVTLGLPANGVIYLSVAGNTGHASGQALVTLGYARCARAWN